MGCALSEPSSTSRADVTAPPPRASTSAPISVRVESAPSPEDAPTLFCQPHIPATYHIGEDLTEKDAEKEVHQPIEKGSAAELQAVLSRRQPSPEQLREEPFCSM
eukprot:RCo053980